MNTVPGPITETPHIASSPQLDPEQLLAGVVKYYAGMSRMGTQYTMFMEVRNLSREMPIAELATGDPHKTLSWDFQAPFRVIADDAERQKAIEQSLGRHINYMAMEYIAELRQLALFATNAAKTFSDQDLQIPPATTNEFDTLMAQLDDAYAGFDKIYNVLHAVSQARAGSMAAVLVAQHDGFDVEEVLDAAQVPDAAREAARERLFSTRMAKLQSELEPWLIRIAVTATQAITVADQQQQAT